MTTTWSGSSGRNLVTTSDSGAQKWLNYVNENRDRPETPFAEHWKNFNHIFADRDPALVEAVVGVFLFRQAGGVPLFKYFIPGSDKGIVGGYFELEAVKR